MKGHAAFFVVLSLIGILVGILLAMKGWAGEGIGPLMTLFLGIFVAVKEVLDLAH